MDYLLGLPLGLPAGFEGLDGLLAGMGISPLFDAHASLAAAYAPKPIIRQTNLFGF